MEEHVTGGLDKTRMSIYK